MTQLLLQVTHVVLVSYRRLGARLDGSTFRSIEIAYVAIRRDEMGQGCRIVLIPGESGIFSIVLNDLHVAIDVVDAIAETIAPIAIDSH